MSVDAGFALPLALPLVLPATVGAPAVTDIPVADFSTLLAAATPMASDLVSVTPFRDPAIAVTRPLAIKDNVALAVTTRPVALATEPASLPPSMPSSGALPTAATLPEPKPLLMRPEPVAIPVAVQAAPDALVESVPPAEAINAAGVDAPTLVAVKAAPRRASPSEPLQNVVLQRPASLRTPPEVEAEAQEPSPATPPAMFSTPPAVAVPDLAQSVARPMPVLPQVTAENAIGTALQVAPALLVSGFGSAAVAVPARAPEPAMVALPTALPTALPVGPSGPVASLKDAGDAPMMSSPKTSSAVASVTDEAPRPGAPAAGPSAPALPIAFTAPAIAPHPQAVSAAIGAERRNRLPIGDGVEAPAPVAVSLGDMMPRLQPARDPAPPPAAGREIAAPAPIMPDLNAEAAIATDRFGDVRIAVEGTATDVKVSLALTPTAVLAAGDAQRLANGLAADLAATGVRLQSLDISGGDTGRGGNPQGQREPTAQRPHPTPFAPPRAPNTPRSDRYA